LLKELDMNVMKNTPSMILETFEERQLLSAAFDLAYSIAPTRGSNVRAGNRLGIVITQKNVGQKISNKCLQNPQIVISKDKKFSANDLVLSRNAAKYFLSSKLAPGKKVKFNTKVTIPDDLKAGDYFLIMKYKDLKVLGPGQQIDRITANNTAIMKIHVNAPKPSPSQATAINEYDNDDSGGNDDIEILDGDDNDAIIDDGADDDVNIDDIGDDDVNIDDSGDDDVIIDDGADDDVNIDDIGDDDVNIDDGGGDDVIIDDDADDDANIDDGGGDGNVTIDDQAPSTSVYIDSGITMRSIYGMRGQTVPVVLKLLDSNGNPIKNGTVRLLKYLEKYQDREHKVIFVGTTDDSGYIKTDYRIPTEVSQDNIHIEAVYDGDSDAHINASTSDTRIQIGRNNPQGK
jgi:hypothetical protein